MTRAPSSIRLGVTAMIRLPALALAALAAVAALAALAVPGPALAERDDAAGFGQPVALNPDIVVEGDTVTLNHLFSGLGDRGATPIARAPQPGEEVRLPADWLARVARAYQVDWRPVSNLQQASLRRAAQRIGGARIVEAIRAELSARGLDGDLDVQLDNRDIALVLPVDAPAKVTVAGFSFDRDSGRFTANVLAPDRQRPLARATVSGKALTMIDVPVLTRRVGRGEVIGQRDIAWVTRPADEVRRNHVRDPRKLVGMSARRSIRPDRPVRETDVTAPVLVPRNSLVTLMLRTEQMRLTVQGRALQDGAKGEVIRVVNTKSNTTVSGVVVADGTVTVDGQPPARPGVSAMRTTLLASAARLSALALVGGLLAACNTADRLAQVGEEPPQSAVESPERLAGEKPVVMPMPEPRMQEPNRQANSLWTPGTRAFFKDQRASEIGDILTVNIDIEDEATLNNNLTRNRNEGNGETAGIDNLLGYENSLSQILPEDVDPSNLVNFGSGSTYGSTGSITRDELIQLELAALITQVLPNGNLVIAGRQEVRVNYENRILQVAGVIRPEDIGSDNSVSYEDIAEARIAYGGEGQLNDIQQPRYGQQIYDILFPF